ncbi:uncharacterized protein LOC143711858 [Siphateles boraxobius]|uniref:uncharacterized protein LOC143711858 n=1 Tax=Siphateles boraxobius TaxID=180520 RepID=UPI00406380D2
MGCGLLLYRPFYSIVVPSVLGVFFTVVFECVGASIGLPAHTRRCKGRPYHWKDVIWGYCMALFVTILHLRSYHVYTLACGSGLTVFALRGAIRKYNALWKRWRYYD